MIRIMMFAPPARSLRPGGFLGASDSATPGQSSSDKTVQPSCARSHPERAVCVCKSQEAITIALHWVSLFAPSRSRICMPVTRSRARRERCKGLPSPLPLAAAAAAATRENFPAGSALVSRTLFSLLQHTGACSPKEGVVQPGWGGGGKGKKLMVWRGGEGGSRRKDRAPITCSPSPPALPPKPS